MVVPLPLPLPLSTSAPSNAARFCGQLYSLSLRSLYKKKKDFVNFAFKRRGELIIYEANKCFDIFCHFFFLRRFLIILLKAIQQFILVIVDLWKLFISFKWIYIFLLPVRIEIMEESNEPLNGQQIFEMSSRHHFEKCKNVSWHKKWWNVIFNSNLSGSSFILSYY